MREDDVPTAAAHPRAVADLPLAELSARRGELCRRWAIALIMRRPLDQLGGVPLEEIVAFGPELLEEMLAAVGSDAALARLTRRGPDGAAAPAARLPAICGARDPAAVAEAGEDLRQVLGHALAQELAASPPADLAAVADRLAYVCTAAIASALRDAAAPPPAAAARGREPTVSDIPQGLDPARSASSGAVPPSRLRETARPTLVDEGGEGPPRPGEPGSAAREHVSVAPAAGAGPAGEISIRDERGEGPGAWIGAIGRQLERHARDGQPFTVLLVELIELERVRADESPQEAERLDAELERTLAAELAGARDATSALVRPPVTEPLAAGAAAALTLTRERPGRYWMVSPASDRGAAHRLSDRIHAALAEWRSNGGRPISVVIGAASCPEDGREAAALAAYADVDLYAARRAALSPR